MRSSAVAVGLAIAASTCAAFAIVAFPREARAFCRTTTAAVPADFQPGPSQCYDRGLPLWWKNACVGYSLQKDASRQVSYDDAANAITRAFTKWTSTTCATDGTGSSRVSVDVRDLGPVSCGLVQYSSDQPNQHVIAFRDDTWPHNDANNTLALTTVVFNPETGEIYDADMEINSAQQKMTLGDHVPADGYDFASIVTHETGHFLGMAHSGDPHATMFAHYLPGSTTLRNLTADDVSGICTIYPPDRTRVVGGAVADGGKVPEESCDPTPRHGFGTQCASPQKKGCSVAAASVGAARALDGAASAWAPWAVLLAPTVSMLFARRLQRKRRRGTALSSWGKQET